MKYIKDDKTSVRYNTELMDMLREKGWTPQKLLDWAMKQQINMEVTVKKNKTEKK